MEMIKNARQAAMEPYSDAPASDDEWLQALALGADAAMRVVLEGLHAEVEARIQKLYSVNRLGKLSEYGEGQIAGLADVHDLIEQVGSAIIGCRFY